MPGEPHGAVRAGSPPLPSPARPPLGARLRRVARRQWRYLRYTLRPPALRLVYDPGYERTMWGVPLDPLRADRTLAFLSDERLIRREEISVPRPAALHNILLVHTPAYVESLQRPEVVTGILGSAVDEREVETVLDVQRLMAGGTIQATRLALAGGAIAVNMGGGFHHASASRGMGFCVFNDIAIAIRRLRRRGYRGRVLVVDADLHDGNGTREVFAADDDVHTFSIHNESWGDVQAVASTSLALGAGVDDDAYLGALVKHLPPVVADFRPDLVIYLAGCDVAADDRIGNWRISAEGLLARDRLVTELVRGRGAPMVVVLGGGYGEAAWRYTARYLSWLVTGTSIEPPGNEELTLVRFRQIKRQLDPAHLTRGSQGNGWELTEEDLVGILPGIPHQTRFLGYFSKVGVELILERFGMLQQLRALGFQTPQVELELDHPLGQTLRIFGGADHAEVLVELRVRRSTRMIEGMELLVVEWLLLQNPRRPLGGERPPLPGQSHPGLGLLGEFFGWLVVLCETLELDGLYYRPNHYHIAAISRPFVRFLEPGHEGLFRALETLLDGLPLADASHAVESGRVIDASTGAPLAWPAPAMVLPVSPRLEERVGSADYQRRAGEAREALDLRLAPAAGGA